MFKKIALGAVAVFVGLLIILTIAIFLQPDDYSVERGAKIDASAPVVFEMVEDFRHWEHWSPWLQLDPDAELTYRGAERGEGAIFEWEGNPDVGSGRMTIVDHRPPEYIEIHLEFFEPYESSTTTAFEFRAEADETTHVTWKMSGENNFASKAIGLFMDMEEMIGEDYEQGLANLAEHTEALAPEG